METSVFREIREEELCEMFSLILRRIEWMDEVGIEQWNCTDYANVYPLSYYEEKRLLGEVFVLEEKGSIVSAAVLRGEDERWEDSGADTRAPSVYLHNFVSRLGCPGAGLEFIKKAEEYAKSCGKVYFRLDSAVGNTGLEQYYEKLGYVPVGRCVDGPYEGILREKKL